MELIRRQLGRIAPWAPDALKVGMLTNLEIGKRTRSYGTRADHVPNAPDMTSNSQIVRQRTPIPQNYLGLAAPLLQWTTRMASPMLTSRSKIQWARRPLSKRLQLGSAAKYDVYSSLARLAFGIYFDIPTQPSELSVLPPGSRGGGPGLSRADCHVPERAQPSRSYSSGLNVVRAGPTAWLLGPSSLHFYSCSPTLLALWSGHVSGRFGPTLPSVHRSLPSIRIFTLPTSLFCYRHN